MKKLIYSGVRKENDNYIFDFSTNYDTDIIKIQEPNLYKAFRGMTAYWFGYTFEKDVSSKERTEFIRYIKGLSEDKISDTDLNNFIQIPLQYLSKEIDLMNIDAFVYPLSGRSRLVSQIVLAINSLLSRDTKKISFEFIKRAPTDIQFDWESFNSMYEQDTNQYKQMKEYIDNVLMPKIQDLDYFSIARDVKPKYRKFITNFIGMSDSDIESYSRLKNKSVLIIDDINTSGSTIDEILRILNKINSTCKVYIYTLIGPINKVE